MDIRLSSVSLVALDLDDTLYREKDYVYSGILAISKVIRDLFSIEVFDCMKRLFNDGDDDWIGIIIKENKLPYSLHAELVALMRTHIPTIEPFDGVAEFINVVQNFGARLCLISDGRSLTQRNKLHSLGLIDLFDDIYISDEVGYRKPDLHSFICASSGRKAKDCYYLGDNPSKDFIAPNELGWCSMMYVGCDDNVHDQSYNNGRHAPKYLINSYRDFRFFRE